jgi:dUTP pyrophosphatase
MSCSDKCKITLNYKDSRKPVKGSVGSAGYDLFSHENGIIEPYQHKAFDTGISMTCFISCYGRVAPRSGLAYKHGIDVLAGVIDSDYTGPVKVILQNNSVDAYAVKKGERIAQLIFEKIANPELLIVDHLGETDRGSGGFGSTGNM